MRPEKMYRFLYDAQMRPSLYRVTHDKHHKDENTGLKPQTFFLYLVNIKPKYKAS